MKSSSSVTLFITLGALAIVAVNLTKRPRGAAYVGTLSAPSIPASQPIAQSNLEARFADFEVRLEKAAVGIAGTAALVGSASRALGASTQQSTAPTAAPRVSAPTMAPTVSAAAGAAAAIATVAARRSSVLGKFAVKGAGIGKSEAELLAYAEPSCNPTRAAGFQGGSLNWGMSFKVRTANDCCDACKSHARVCLPGSGGKIFMNRTTFEGKVVQERCAGTQTSNEHGTAKANPCNVFVFCPTPPSAGGLCWSNDVWNHTYGEWCAVRASPEGSHRPGRSGCAHVDATLPRPPPRSA